MTNEQTLNEVYKRITAYEMVQKLKNCGVVWDQLNTVQYQATIEQGDHVWDIFLTKAQDRVVLDFRRNMSFFFTMDSNSEPIVDEMFREIEGDDDFERDRALLRDMGKLRPGCYNTFNIVMNGGARVGGNGRILTTIGGRGGAVLAGVSELGKDYVTKGGVTAGNTSTVQAQYAPTTSGGAKANGSGNNIYSEPVTGGMLMNGTAVVTADFVTKGGVRGGSTATVTKRNNPTPSGGAKANGTAIVTKIP